MRTSSRAIDLLASSTSTALKGWCPLAVLAAPEVARMFRCREYPLALPTPSSFRYKRDHQGITPRCGACFLCMPLLSPFVYRLALAAKLCTAEAGPQLLDIFGGVQNTHTVQILGHWSLLRPRAGWRHRIAPKPLWLWMILLVARS